MPHFSSFSSMPASDGTVGGSGIAGADDAAGGALDGGGGAANAVSAAGAALATSRETKATETELRFIEKPHRPGPHASATRTGRGVNSHTGRGNATPACTYGGRR